MSQRYQQNSFAGGELSPDLYGRVDIALYNTGLRTLLNGFVNYHGGCSNRPGTKYVINTKGDSAARLIPFSFNTSQTYVLEFTNLCMRVITNGGVVLESAQTITNITQANPAVVTITAHPYANGDQVYISGVSGMTEVNGYHYLVANATANTFEITDLDGNNIDSTGFTAYSSGGTAERVYELTTPYVEADLATIKFTQSADVMTIAHPSYEERELVRVANDSWTLTTLTLAPLQASPTGLSGSGGGSGSTTYTYKVTAIADDETQEESLPTAEYALTNKNANLASNPITLNWTGAAGAGKYSVYKERNGIFGFIGETEDTTFKDDAIDAELADTPPKARDPFSGADNYPATVSYFQQRLMFGSTNNNPTSIYTSQSGNFKNFGFSSPPKADDAITFAIAARQVNEIRHMIPLRDLVVLTSGGAWLVSGDSNGVLTPTSVNVSNIGYIGSAHVRPLLVGSEVLYVSEKGARCYQLGYTLESDGYLPTDITIKSSHLFRGYTIKEWEWAREPWNVAWAVRNDGTLLSVTYVPEQQVIGWGRHETDGEYESIAVVGEGEEDVPYFVVKRTINGTTRRHVERMQSRVFSSIKDAFFVDDGLSYDGRRVGLGQTITITTATTYVYGEDLTATIAGSTFSSGDVGNVLVLRTTDDDGVETDVVRLEITAYTNATTVTVRGNKDIPAAFQATAIADFDMAEDTFAGLDHLEGKTVSILSDGFVHPQVTVTNGAVTLQEAGGVVHIGLPYTSDFVPLDLALQPNKQTERANLKSLIGAYLYVKEARGVFAGRDEDNLRESKPLRSKYDGPVDTLTRMIEIKFGTSYTFEGRFMIRQEDPLPITLLSIIPEVEFGG